MTKIMDTPFKNNTGLRKIGGTAIVAVLVSLAACGGGSSGTATAVADSSASETEVASDPGAASAPDTASSPQPAAFNCPADYKRLDIATGTAPGTPMNLVTDDNIATLTLTVPDTGVLRALTVCLGKPDPVPAGVQAAYAYEITGLGNIQQLDGLLTFNFTTTLAVAGVPAIELASVTGAGVSYSPTVAGAVMAVKPNYSVSARVNQKGLYVIRLTK